MEVAELSRRFNVSVDTVRRDLRVLQSSGLIRKTHGGAIRHLTHPAPYDSRMVHSPTFKQAIGRRAAELVEEGDSIIIDSGTTTLCLAQSLQVSRARVITNSLEIARAIAGKPNYELFVLGGKWDPVHHDLVGPRTVEQLLRYRVDKVFLGMVALDPRNGFTDNSEEDAAVKRAMIQVAEQAIGLADSTKMGNVAFVWVAPVSDIDILVTDDQADCAAFEDIGLKVIKAAAN